jgi:hypothetical protein
MFRGKELEDPLPKVSYDTMKDKQIKNLLSEHNLSIVGDRDKLIARHRRYVLPLLYVAQHSPYAFLLITLHFQLGHALERQP